MHGQTRPPRKQWAAGAAGAIHLAMHSSRHAFGPCLRAAAALLRVLRQVHQAAHLTRLLPWIHEVREDVTV